MTDAPEPAGVGLEARFPDPTDRTPASGPDHGSRRPYRFPVAGTGIAVSVGLVVAVLGWFRLPMIARGTLWAEDSRLFLQQRIGLGPWASLFHPYDGYQHLVPRVLTDVAVLVAPIDRYAEVVTVLALVAVGATASATYAFSGGLVRTRVARLGLALVPVLVPMTAVELLGNFANRHWFALYLAPFALLHRPTTRVRAAWQTFALLAISMTEIQTVVFVPLVLLLVRSRRAWPGGAAFLFGLAAQFGTYLLDARVRTNDSPFVPADVVRGFFAEPVLSVWVHDHVRAAQLLVEHGSIVLAIAFLPFAVSVVVVLVARWSARSLLTIVLALGAVVLWAVDLYVNPTALFAFGANGWALLGVVGYVRYALAPSMLLVALVVLAADRLLDASRAALVRHREDATAGGAPVVSAGRRGRGIVAGSLGTVLLVGLVVVFAGGFTPTFVSRIGGPLWSTSVQGAESACAGEPAQHRERIDGAPTGWGVYVACADIDGSDRFP